jgi:molybdopterin-binding protein
LVLVSLVVVSLGRGGIIVTVVTTEVVDSLGFPIEVGLDHHLTGGVLGGDV